MCGVWWKSVIRFCETRNMYMVQNPAKMFPFALVNRSTLPDLFCLMFIPASIQSKWFELSVMVIFFIYSEPGRHK